ncbi:MAG: DNA primase [Bacteroidaceae bacterium]|nr:DNA primase [Bacteroidaceae bacterium]
MIDRITIDKIRSAANIYDIVKEFVTLKKAGANYKGLCPFHDEKTPSFIVSPSKQLFKCFSCGEGGDAVGFIMKHEQMTYPEALKWIAKRYGIEVREKEETEEEKKESSEREAMFAANQWARDYFTDTLYNNVEGVAIGMAYFRARGFRDDIIKKFQLGFCLPERDAMAQAALKRGYAEEYLVKTGLCVKTEDGKLLDRYHGRVIFPVHTISGRVVAFGGRVLNTEKQKNVGKYVNSPESSIYNKSHELYGLYLAKHAITKHDRCFLVEGYTDVISMHQAGIENVVSSSGTSLTVGQIRLLRRFTHNITLLYDGDAAGIKASLRGIDLLLAEGMNIKVVLLPEGEDPDSFARNNNAQKYWEYIEAHQTDFIRFKTNLLLKDAESDPQKRSEVIRDIVNSIAVIPDRIVRQTYISQCAEQVKMEERIIAAEVGKQMHQNNRPEGSQAQEGEQEEQPSVPATNTILRGMADSSQKEFELVKAIIRHGSALLFSEESEDGTTMDWTVANYIAADLENDGIALQTPLYAQILSEALPLADSEEQKYVSLHYFMQAETPEIQQLATQVAEDNYTLSKKQLEEHNPDENRLVELIPHLLNEYKFHIVESRLKELLLELRNPEVLQSPERARAIMEEHARYNQLKKVLSPMIGKRIITR